MVVKTPIYLDNDASTPTDPRVIQAIETNLKELYANPSSVHSFGRESRKCLLQARDTLSSFLKVHPEEIIFTSGGTEGANMILRGLFHTNFEGHIITSSVEHPSVYNTIKELEKLGCDVTYLQPGEWGAVTPQSVQSALKPNTKLIAIMAVNNETGVITDIEGIARIAHEAGVPFFVDGVAWLGKEKFEVPEGVSSISFSGAKIYALKGVGFSFIRRGLKLKPLMTGGGQEYGRRAGTENLSSIVGLAEAVSILEEQQLQEGSRVRSLRDKLEKALMEQLGDVSVNGEGPRVGTTSNLCFNGVDGESLLAVLDMQGVAASHGSACESGSLEPSRVLSNLGLPIDRVRSSLRFSLGRFTTEEEIDIAVSLIVTAVNRIRNL